jgi:hypothetical protein
MTGWIDGTLDELDARLRELKREVSWLEDRGLGRIHDASAYRRRLSGAAERHPADVTQHPQPVRLLPHAA